MNDPMTAIGPDEPFTFECSRESACFNACCRDLNQFLTPYDILRLKQALNLSSTDFLASYTLEHIGPETGLPIVTLRPADAHTRICPFVTPEGCRVYPARPGSCRMYPLARLATRSRETGAVTEHYALIREPHCLGFRQSKPQTPKEWIEDQELAVYNEINDLLMTVISSKNQNAPGPLSIADRQLFRLAAYDLDGFREAIFEKDLLGDNATIEPELLRQLREDDLALLRFGLQWIQKTLFAPQ